MAENSKIEWTDHTVNFWEGCQKVSPACDHCYAEDRDRRFHGGAHWGAHADRGMMKDPMAHIRKIVRIAEKEEHPQKIFINSVSDWADNHRSIQDERRALIFEAARAYPEQITLQLLTKRPQNIPRFLPKDWGNGYENVWLGTTVENQTEADRRIPHLLKIPAKVRFLSCEPLLGPIDLSIGLGCTCDNDERCFGTCAYYKSGGNPNRIDWLICGGESGAKARPMHPDWARSLRDQCKAAGVPFFMKQMGGKRKPFPPIPDDLKIMEWPV